MKYPNATTIISLAIGGLAYMDQIMSVLGVIAILTAIIVNVFTYRTKRAEKRKHDIERQLAEQRLKDLQDEE